MIGHVEVMAGRWARRFAPARSAYSGRQLMKEEVNADEILLASTQGSSDPATLTAVKTAIVSEEWTSGKPPRLRVITRLGTSEVADNTESAVSPRVLAGLARPELKDRDVCFVELLHQC